jgi:hypothetical protein
VKFRRKSTEVDETTDAVDGAADTAADAGAADVERTTGPFDIDDLARDDEVDRLDLGSLLIEPVEGLELRLQVDEEESTVQAVVLAGPEGIVELRAFAAPRGGDLWNEIMPRIAAEYAQRGGTASMREGRYGTELDCKLTVRTDDGRTGTQVSRVAGINGERWMLRATFMGRPALEPDADGPWAQAVEKVVVRRGTHAMPVGAELPLTMPPQAQRI